MANDIANRQDVEHLVNTFYQRVRADETIGFIFNSIIGSDWSHHLPVMYSFWESVLFSKAGYQGNPISGHINVDRRIPLTQQHFDRWLELWTATVNENFSGPNADQAKNRASLMANLIWMKVQMGREPGFVQ